MVDAAPHLAVSIKVPEDGDLCLELELHDWTQHFMVEGPSIDSWKQLPTDTFLNPQPPQVISDQYGSASACNRGQDANVQANHHPVHLSEDSRAGSATTMSSVLGTSTNGATVCPIVDGTPACGAPDGAAMPHVASAVQPGSCVFHDGLALDGFEASLLGFPSNSGSSGSPASTGINTDWDLSLAMSVSGPEDNIWDDKLNAVDPHDAWDLGSALQMDLDLLDGLSPSPVPFPMDPLKQESNIVPCKAVSDIEALFAEPPQVPSQLVPVLQSAGAPQQAVPASPGVVPQQGSSPSPGAVPQVPGRREVRRKASFSRLTFEDFTSDDDEDEYSLPAPKRNKGARGPRRVPQSHSRGPALDTPDGDLSGASEGEDKKRRKQHNPWNLEETEVLIAGVEKCGGGRWADIKKLGFAAIERRSAVDLKDKWRNLIRVACQSPQQAARTKCDKRREIPEELLARVRAVVEASGGQHSRRTSHRGA